jgi:hypothetical protein
MAQIDRCALAWEALRGDLICPLDVSNAARSGSLTRYVEDERLVRLGADAFPGHRHIARSRMSYVACLAHELSHARRHSLGFNRPIALPDKLLDEAETSLDASFETILGLPDRCDLVEDARDQLEMWHRDVCIGGAR